MQNLLETVTQCIDEFAGQSGAERLAAIIGGEAAILHGVPRTTLDLDILLHYGSGNNRLEAICPEFAIFLSKKLEANFEIKSFQASKYPFDPIRHDLVIVTDSGNKYKKLDILMANYQWELEGLREMESAHEGLLRPYPMPYLTGMKLMAGGIQDEQDIRNFFLIMSDSEKEKAFDLARLIRRDKNLSKILARGKRSKPNGRNDMADLELKRK